MRSALICNLAGTIHLFLSGVANNFDAFSRCIYRGKHDNSCNHDRNVESWMFHPQMKELYEAGAKDPDKSVSALSIRELHRRVPEISQELRK